MLEDTDLSNIQDENTRQLVVRLMNLIEAVTTNLGEAGKEIQRLRDGIKRLKGEQGKPKIKGSTAKPPRVDHSSGASQVEGKRPEPAPGLSQSERRNVHFGTPEGVLRDFPRIRPRTGVHATRRRKRSEGLDPTRSEPRRQRSRLVANRLWKWTKLACRRMPSSRATKAVCCRIPSFPLTTYASTKRSIARRRRAKPF